VLVGVMLRATFVKLELYVTFDAATAQVQPFPADVFEH
jgi:hypothetical protein